MRKGIRVLLSVMLSCALAVSMLGCSELGSLLGGQPADALPQVMADSPAAVMMRVERDSVAVYATTDGGEPIATLAQGSTVSVDSITTIDGVRWGRTPGGWVQLDGLVETDGEDGYHYAPYGTVKADILNIRSGPGTEYTIVGKLPHGSSVVFLEFVGGWGRIDQGWVSLDYIIFRDTPGQVTDTSPEVVQPDTPVATQPVSAPDNTAIVGQWISASAMPDTGRVYRSSTVNYYADGTYELIYHDCIFMYTEADGWVYDPNAPGAGSQRQSGTYTFDGITLTHTCTFIEWEDPSNLPQVTSYQVQIQGNTMTIDGSENWYYGDLQEVCNFLMGK